MTQNARPMWKRTAAGAILAMSVVLASSGLGVAGAAPLSRQGDPISASAAPAYVKSIDRVSDRQLVVNVFSPSMDKLVPIKVITPADNSQPRPILYLLNGADGGEGTATWLEQTDVVDFFGDKNVNVAIPSKGTLSYYTDWEREDAKLGKNLWSTFLGKDLPPLLNKVLGSNGDQAIAGMSMSATSVFNLAIEHPGLYKSIASYSGCAQTSDPMGQSFVKATTEWIGGVDDITNMWGPLDGPGWTEHDPVVNAETLRGTPMYISTGSGLPGIPNDTFLNPRLTDGRAFTENQIIIGGPIEFATSVCTGNLARRLADLSIPAVVDFRPVGTHSWGYWQDDLHKSWPFLAASLGV